ncbi:succinylglutamate desuccinylase/aspartoacylase family protein [Rubidibacter lacunae]|nr:succinylglutamate desuccinylase/aspartoacylase family protein [Rubidibacter lacunae]
MAIAPGGRELLEIPVTRLPTQTSIALPVTVLHGCEPGPRLWLSAAIHGDEINGVEIVRQVLERVHPEQLRGTLIAAPIVNVFGFIEQSRYLPDRRDLNRSFPGSPDGSLAARLAHLFMREIVSRCTHGIDLHTASDHRTNLPQIRANLHDRETRRCALAFGAPVAIHATTRDGSLRQAAAKRGIPVLLFEGGEALRFDMTAIRVGVAGVLQVMTTLEMLPAAETSPALVPPEQPLSTSMPQEVFQTKWVRAARSGILRLGVRLGDRVEKRQVLGVIADAFGATAATVRAPIAGLAIGQTLNPLVNQGDAILHLAVLGADAPVALAIAPQGKHARNSS